MDISQFVFGTKQEVPYGPLMISVGCSVNIRHISICETVFSVSEVYVLLVIISQFKTLSIDISPLVHVIGWRTIEQGPG